MADETGKITNGTKDFAGSGVEGKKEGDPDAASERRAKVRQNMIVSGIGELDPATEYTKSGKPDVKALVDLLGFDIDAKERDAAFAVFAANMAVIVSSAATSQELADILASTPSDSRSPAVKQTTILTGEHVLAIQREQGKEV